MDQKLFKGGINAGMLYIILIMVSLIGFSFYMVGGKFPSMSPTITPPPNTGDQKIVFEQVKDPGKKNLQLQTFKVKNSCEDKIAVDFLIDVSGSMKNHNKIGKEKNALRSFSSKMSDSSIIGIQVFSNPDFVRELVPISLYKDVKTQVQDAINSLPADGATSTRSGFDLAKQKLSEVISQNKFPGYKYNLVFISDGIPEVANIIHNPTNCLVVGPYKGQSRCFAKEQDPRTPSNIPQEIKGLGVDLYSIAITDSIDQPFKTELLQLLRDASSDPDTKYFYESVDGDNLQTVLENVLKSICS